MTTRRFSRRARNPVRRAFFQSAGTGTVSGTTMVDQTPVPELGSTSDSQFGDLLVTGMGVIDQADEMAIGQVIVWVGRTSTQPAVEDTGVRTRQWSYNQQGVPFVMRFRGLRVNPGEVMKLNSFFISETLATLVHQHLISTKWSFRELRQG